MTLAEIEELFRVEITRQELIKARRRLEEKVFSNTTEYQVTLPYTDFMGLSGSERKNMERYQTEQYIHNIYCDLFSNFFAKKWCVAQLAIKLGIFTEDEGRKYSSRDNGYS